MILRARCPLCGETVRVKVTFPPPRLRDQHGRWVIQARAAAEMHRCNAAPQEDR